MFAHILKIVKDSFSNRFLGDPGAHKATLTPIACVSCKYWGGRLNPRECEAFPDGIPSDILSGMNNHSTPVKGDGGLRYTPKGK